MNKEEENIRTLAHKMSVARTGKEGLVSAQDYHMAIVAIKHEQITEVVFTVDAKPITMPTKPTVAEAIKSLKLTHLHSGWDEDVLVSAYAGTTIHRAIEDALALHGKTGKRIIFEFNDKLVKVGKGSTYNGVFDAWVKR